MRDRRRREIDEMQMTRNGRRLGLALLGLAWTGLAWAADEAGVEITNAWAKATVPGQPVAGAFVELKARKTVQLVAVESPIAKRGEIHEMSQEGGVMRMRAMKSVKLPAGRKVAFSPGGMHFMLFDPAKPLAAGSTVELTLSFRMPDGKVVKQTVQADVRSPDAAGEGHEGHGGHDMHEGHAGHGSK
jgi:periplasmic copper chaperone A